MTVRKLLHHNFTRNLTCCQTFHIRCTVVGNEIVDHSDVVRAAPFGDAPTISSFLTQRLVQWIGQRQLQDEMRNIWVLGFGVPYIRLVHHNLRWQPHNTYIEMAFKFIQNCWLSVVTIRSSKHRKVYLTSSVSGLNYHFACDKITAATECVL